MSLCVSVSRLYELFTQKYSSSVKVVYISTVHDSIYIVCVCVSYVYELSFSHGWGVLGMMSYKIRVHTKSVFLVLSSGGVC